VESDLVIGPSVELNKVSSAARNWSMARFFTWTYLFNLMRKKLDAIKFLNYFSRLETALFFYRLFPVLAGGLPESVKSVLRVGG
jgi:hypothetical protein